MNQPDVRRFSADTDGKVGGAGTAPGKSGQAGFYDAVLQGVEGNHRQPPPLVQPGDRPPEGAAGQALEAITHRLLGERVELTL